MIKNDKDKGSKQEIKEEEQKVVEEEEIDSSGPKFDDDPIDKVDGQVMEMVLAELKSLREQVEYLENKKSSADVAKLYIANRMFNTDPNHLRELTIVPLRGVKALAHSDAVGSILSVAVQSGQVSPAQVWKESHHRYMRSVKGNLLEKGKELALEEARQSEGEPDYDEAGLGEGL